MGTNELELNAANYLAVLNTTRDFFTPRSLRTYSVVNAAGQFLGCTYATATGINHPRFGTQAVSYRYGRDAAIALAAAFGGTVVAPKGAR